MVSFWRSFVVVVGRGGQRVAWAGGRRRKIANRHYWKKGSITLSL
jgi:hypothetical protein